ncbi:MAG: nucleotidyl transferase AbiEii/AbiGii toxin family protein [Eubacteriaceae bacterium]|nr:nucleotidyl transferase AbiEii/AbiGii toxin family protein [Eubacteriaceae bacterium]
MKNAMQLKAVVKRIAKEKHISAQLVLQNYTLERLLERIALSPYRDHFVIKGGFLIASMIGLNARATMDMDATVTGYPVNLEVVERMIKTILAVTLDDGFAFELRQISEIRKDDQYTGYRIALTANYEKMAIPLKLDMTTGDRMTPRQIIYDYPLMFENRCIRVMAYNLPTILAEKLQTILSRGDQNTRPRDFYDVFILTKLKGDQIDPETRFEALRATAEKRASIESLTQYQSIMQVVKTSPVMIKRWRGYQRDFDYAAKIAFEEACDAVMDLMDLVAAQREKTAKNH